MVAGAYKADLLNQLTAIAVASNKAIESATDAAYSSQNPNHSGGDTHKLREIAQDRRAELGAMIVLLRKAISEGSAP